MIINKHILKNSQLFKMSWIKNVNNLFNALYLFLSSIFKFFIIILFYYYKSANNEELFSKLEYFINLKKLRLISIYLKREERKIYKTIK